MITDRVLLIIIIMVFMLLAQFKPTTRTSPTKKLSELLFILNKRTKTELIQVELIIF